MTTDTNIHLDPRLLMKALRARWKTVFAFVVVSTAAAAAYAAFAPRWYESSVVVMPASDIAGDSLLGAASELMGNVGIELPGGSASDSDKIQAVFTSRSVTDAVIKKFDLTSRYSSEFIEKTRKLLWKHCEAKVDKNSGMVSLTCEDRDPNIAQQMTQYMGKVANEVFGRISAGAAGEQRRFLEVRLAQVRKDLDGASRALRDFQQEHKLIDLGAQSQAAVQQIATLHGDITSKQLQLRYLDSFASANEPSALQLRQQIAIGQQKLSALEDGRKAARAEKQPSAESTGSDVFPVLTEVPRLRFELEELFRQQKIQETLFLLLTQQYELAKMNEARQASQFQTMDAPVVAERHARPKATIVLLIGFAIGLMLASAWILWSKDGRAAVRAVSVQAP